MNDFNLTTFLTHLTTEPGVYRMLDEAETVLYVGKASNLKKRVGSYFNKQAIGLKTRALVNQIAKIEVTITRSESEALLLESNLIKTLRPKYNVVLRDDKTYPYIQINSDHDFPRIDSFRAKKKPNKGTYFGPYPSVSAMRETLGIIHKVFKIRGCRDSYFAARSRPCLQYQIKRCSAPCVGYISQEDYQQSLNDAIRFLQGKCQLILQELEKRMEEAVERLAFEEAAQLRDQIKSLRLVQQQQSVVQLRGDADVIVFEVQPGFSCVQYVTIRDGQVIASRAYFPEMPEGYFDEEDLLQQHVLEAFVSHYYIDNPERIPALILVDQNLGNLDTVSDMLSKLRGKTCQIQVKPRGVKARWIDFALNNLRLSVVEHHASTATIMKRYQALVDLLRYPTPIHRIECFDISHTQGVETVASCVVFNQQGPSKKDYRRFNITGITGGDDYAAMKQAITRRYRHATPGNLPDILLIDGGKGQVKIAREVIQTLGISAVSIIGIAKGVDRKAGWERLLLSDTETEMTLAADSPALHLLQHIRDEAHRFAITTHRKKRQTQGFESSLLTIEGIGTKRKQALLKRFGGIRALALAPLEEMVKVNGISEELAIRIYSHFHPELNEI